MNRVSNTLRMRILLITALVLILSALALTVGAQDGNVLRFGVDAPVELDPAIGPNDQETMFNRMIYDYLIDVDADNNLVPNLATEWTISDDGLTYTLPLREGVTFHDGKAFSSADVVYTFERLQSLGSPALGLLGEFTVSANGDNEVVFELSAPSGDFLYGLASRFALILPEGQETPNVLDEAGDNPYVNFNGTGAFILTDYSPGESATFTKNENYWWEGQPALDGVELIFINDTQSQIAALRGGTVDAIFKLPINQIDVLEAEDGISVLERATNRHPVIRLRADEGFPGADVNLRLAFKYATDRELLNLDVEGGLGVVGNNDPIGPAYGAYYTALDNQGADPERACELVAEAGYTDDNGDPYFETEFYVVDAFNYAQLATNLQQQWEEGCIHVELLIREEGIYYGDNEWMDVALGLTGWGHRPIAQAYLNEAYISDGIYNESHWSNARLDELAAEASTTADPDARAAIYAEISQIFHDEGPIIIPYFASIIGATSDSVEGLVLNPFAGRTDLRTVSLGN